MRAVVARPLPLCLAFVFFSNLCSVVKARVTSAAFWSWGTISHECITNAALWCLEALKVNELVHSSLELCSVDIALDRRRQEVLVVPPRAPCEDGDHVPAGDVVPALAVAVPPWLSPALVPVHLYNSVVSSLELKEQEPEQESSDSCPTFQWLRACCGGQCPSWRMAPLPLTLPVFKNGSVLG